jgi:hypothetical protein
MDDIVAFYRPDSWIGQYFGEAEKRLVARANHVFFSSEHLARTVMRRTDAGIKHTLVRNAYNPQNRIPEIGAVKPVQTIAGNRPKKLAYFGTISSWLDLNTLIHCTVVNPELRIDLFGPLESRELLKSLPSSIQYKGILPHARLRESAGQYDVLLMPFLINDLIKSVDPVKLYEYIDFNKPIISSFYPEIRRFENFVNFYRNQEEFAELLMRSCDELKKYSSNERTKFLKSNTWDERAKTMKGVLVSV